MSDPSGACKKIAAGVGIDARHHFDDEAIDGIEAGKEIGRGDADEISDGPRIGKTQTRTGRGILKYLTDGGVARFSKNLIFDRRPHGSDERTELRFESVGQPIVRGEKIYVHVHLSVTTAATIRIGGELYPI